MPKYALTYFDGEGLGEPIRLLLHYGKIEFEDRRVDYEKDWEAIKASERKY